MNVAAVRGLRSVDVAMCVEPCQTESFVVPAVVARGTSDASNCQTVVSANCNRDCSLGKGIIYCLRHVQANFCNFRQASYVS